MTRSHPPTLLRLAEGCLREECSIARGHTVLVACSGGPDSSALLHALALLRRRVGYELLAHGIDHGLRPEAPRELAVAAGIAADLGVPFQTTTLRVAAGANLQDRARRARLDALGRAAQASDAVAIATGHTADDRAETVLLRLLRGAGPRGLAALPARAAGPHGTALIRPMVRARRAAVLAHLARHSIPSASDPSNMDPAFLRVRVRRELLPLLEQLSPGIVEHLCALADMLEEGAPDARKTSAGGLDPAAEAWLAGLGRAQRQAIERGRRLGRRSVRIRVQGGADLEITFRNGQLVLMPHLSPTGGPSRPAGPGLGPPRSTAGVHGGMLVDSEGKGTRPRQARHSRRLDPPRSPRRGSS